MAPPKTVRKGQPEPARLRGPAPVLHPHSRPQTPPRILPSPLQPPFPPLAGANGASAQDKVLQSLAGLTGTTITLITKTTQRYEGVIASTGGEGDTPGVTLRDVKEISNPGGPLKDQLFIASTNIDTWASGPADAKVPNGEFQKKPAPRERELQAWQPSPDAGPNLQTSGGVGDEETFGAGSKGQWDQFNVNEKLFGVKTSFDEDAYTTKLDRSAPDFKERERKAQRIANEIIGAGTNNPHIAEERNQNVDDSGANEEDKYGAVVRGNNAYVPPGARKTGGDTAAPAAGNAAKAAGSDIPKLAVNGPDGTSVVPSQTPSKSPSPAPLRLKGSLSRSAPANDPVTAFSDFVTNEKQRLQQKRQALVKSDMDKRMADLVKFSQSFKLNKPIPDDLVPILAKDEEKQRAIKEKSTKDAASAQARNIGASSSPSTAPGAPRGGPPLAAKISGADSGRKPSAPAATKPAAAPAAGAAKPAPAKPAAAPTTRVSATGKSGISMVIQSIPPFKGTKTRQSSQPTAPTAGARPPNMTASATTSALSTAAPASPNPANANANANPRLNVAAPSFKPNPKANAFTPGAPSPNPSASASASVSPKPKSEAPTAPNPFFGTRPIKKNTAAHIKDDFNPFKHNKVVEAAQVSAMWPYNGKRYMLMFPQQTQQQHPQQQQQQHSPHMQPPGPVPMPPPSYEEDSAAQAAQRGYVYAYPPYAYPPQMMPPGMVPPGPPGAWGGPYMQAMPYPPGMPPPNMYASPSMGQMPPPQAYMPPPPPGTYPPPNGAGPRPSMPPTPIPAHAHPYYHQSPQLQHAVPYPMMMQQPPNGPVHPYDPSGGVPVPAQMGGHA
ncbi:LsmAD domain-containing protein [Mycena venus]|uniref:LsmAD domain-containing protein n=1 Tax=Mycena venus TaxID=2733690 RepID=A0A8H6WXM4_9AGAR|nr:LsmAD domain-containing protein [Mycena venus]